MLSEAQSITPRRVNAQREQLSHTLIMARSDHYRTRAEECRARAETSFTPEAWLKLAATWLALIPVSREAASERSKAMEQPGSGMTGPLRPDKGGEDYQSLEECVGNGAL